MSRTKTRAEQLRELHAKPKAPSAEQIRATRQAVGLSQSAAGQLCFVALRTWQSWEGGEREMQPAIWGWWLTQLLERSQL